MRFPISTSEYSSLKTLSGSWGPVYGPFKSRRLGLSLGINILGSDEKICSFDCPYCEFGPTSIRMNEIKKSGRFALGSDLIAKIQTQMQQHCDSGLVIDAIAMVGLGEPTLHPDFDEISEALKKIRDEYFPKTPLAVFSNASTLDSRKVQRGMTFFDQRFIKLDAGNDKILRQINAPLVKDTVESLITNARKIKNIIIQSTFIQGAVDNTSNEHIDEWIEAVGMIKPDLVHISTLDRVPAQPGLKRPDEDTLYTIAAKLEKRTRIRWKVFY